MSNSLKKRFNQYDCDMKKFLERGKISTKFSTYFRLCYKKKLGKEYHIKHLRSMCDYHMLYEGKALSAVKLFGTKKYKICMMEKLNIWEYKNRNVSLCLNQRKDIYGECVYRHYFHQLISTEELPGRSEKEV